MRQQFLQLIEKLKSDPGFLVQITDLSSGAMIVNNASGDALTREAGSVEGYFNNLYTNGITRLRFVPRKRNGSSVKAEGLPFVYTLGDDKTAQPQQATPTAEAPAPAAPAPAYALNAPMGLSVPDMHYRVLDHSRMQQENLDLKAENKALTKQVEELKEKVLRNEIMEGKTVAINESRAQMTQAVTPVIEKGFAALAAFMSKSNQPAIEAAGLAGAMNPNQQAFVELFLSIPNDYQVLMARVLEGIEKDAFVTDQITILQKHNLWPNE